MPKRALVDYLDAVRDRILPELRDRPLSVIRVTGGQAPFMQKNVPKYTPDWVETAAIWAEASKRTVKYALCNDRRTLLWFANQRAVEYHPTLSRADRLDRATHLVLDLDPPADAGFAAAVAAAHLVRQALTDVGLAGAVKTSGAKGVHVYVPITAHATMEDAAAATRAIAHRAAGLDPQIATTAFVKDEREGKVFVDATRTGGATVVAAYSPRARAGVPVSYPVGWDDLDDVTPIDFTITTAVEQLGDGDPWAERAAGAAAPVGRPGGRGPRDPRRPGGGDARGQAARSRADDDRNEPRRNGMSDDMKHAWSEVGDGFSALGRMVKERYRSSGDEPAADAAPADSDDDREGAFREAVDRLVAAGRDVGDRAADVARDDEVKEQAKEAAATLNDAINATVNLIGDQVSGFLNRKKGRGAERPGEDDLGADRPTTETERAQIADRDD